jgi:hypothetical protein
MIFGIFPIRFQDDTTLREDVHPNNGRRKFLAFAVVAA